MVGYPKPGSFLSADWGSSLAKTDLNCSLRMHALESAGISSGGEHLLLRLDVTAICKVTSSFVRLFKCFIL